MRRRWLSKLAIGSKCNARFLRGAEQRCTSCDSVTVRSVGRRTAKKRVAIARLAHQTRQETPIAEIFLRDILGVSRDFRLWHSQRNSEAASVGVLRLGF